MTVNGIKAENTELRQEVVRLDEALAIEVRRSANLASEKADARVQYSKLRDVCRAQEEVITRLTAENERLTIEVEAAKKFGDGFYGEKVTEGVREVYRGFARAALSGDKHE